MKILITGACGFIGSTLCQGWIENGHHEVIGFDSLARPGSEVNRVRLSRFGVKLYHGDVRNTSDIKILPVADVVVEAAAIPSVLAGIDDRVSSRQLVEHNLLGTLNMLEYCQRHRSMFILLSTSRVYSIPVLANLPLRVSDGAFEPDLERSIPSGLTRMGIKEDFSTAAPISLYGATKLASEQLALEYGCAFGFPVWINRCGVLAGAGQFGRPDQGIFAYWINSWLRRRSLKYIGFGGLGYQVRDCLHPLDLLSLLERQMMSGNAAKKQIVNVSGGRASATSVRQLSAWCRERLGEHTVLSQPDGRMFDLPWVVLDATLADETWNWKPSRPTAEIFEEILQHAEQHPEWLELSNCS